MATNHLARSAEGTKPLNIVILMADQWRWDTLFASSHRCRTPNIDRFAAKSAVFPHAFSSYPLCCPARGSLFTGLWPHQCGLVDNVQGGSYYPYGKLAPRLATYLERLRDKAGYTSSYAGKWHMGRGTATERGIDLVDVSDGGAAGHRGEDCPGFELNNGALRPYYGTFSSGTLRDHCAIQAGIGHLRKLAVSKQPFCSVISTWGPHFPHFVPEDYAKLYAGLPDDLQPSNYSPPFSEEGKPVMQSRPYWPCQNTRPLTSEDWRRIVQSYWAYCTFLDDQFGRVLDAVESLGIADRTLVAFVVDHGEMLGAHGNFDKGPYFYEEVMRIPFIVRDPLGRQPFASDSFVSLRDLFPTLVDLSGAEGVLSSDEQARSAWRSASDAAFYCYDSYHGRQFKLRGIRTKRFKYNWSPHDLSELYDLETDPCERTNRITDPVLADVRDRLHGRLMAWMKAEGDYLLCATHLPPPGTYIDGRSVDEQHDPGVWTEAQKVWYNATEVRRSI